MNRKRSLKVKEIFSFLEVGIFYWRLLILPFAGVFLFVVSFSISENITFGKGVLSFSATFYTLFLLILGGWIGSFVRDKIINRNVIDLILLWPLNKRKKLFWIQLRSTWIPAILLILGAMIGGYFLEPSALGMLLNSLPYGLALAFFLSVLIWKGSYDVTEVGDFVGKVSYREEIGLSLLTTFLCFSPILLELLPFYVQNMVSIGLLLIGFVYRKSSKHEIQIGGGECNQSKSPENGKPQDLSFLKSIKNPMFRYFYYLEWDYIKKPIKSYLINIAAVSFIVLIYYAYTGLFSSNNDISNFHRSLFISLLVSYTSVFMHQGEQMMNNEMKILLPLSPIKKAITHLLNRILRPTAYAFLNIIGVVLIIGLSHRGLSLIIQQPYLPYGSLILEIFMYTLMLLPLSIAAFSLLDFILKGLMVVMQGLGFFKVCSLLNRGTFFFYFFPLLFLVVMRGEELPRIEIFIRHSAIPLYLGVFVLSQMGLYWTMKKIQVISS
ncbi:hypothetical protein EDC18_11365 [Natranaerovirga pectinivora]|uniref:Uncharacterized protein n=1 Tax=Natranaerovirga pectinivora TaxID=682400 RepID=A0A4R3MKA6_9FIRM|nr:hypothetical protein [Natranaerovirga pectinivora]TCT12219.1 hypothetical protein EDC18_11365 [Natranaerovirga pectinivora]